MNQKVVRDGRKAKVFMLVKGATKASAIEAYKIYGVVKKASSSSVVPSGINVGEVFIATAAVASVPAGDEIYELSVKFLGGATDKSLNQEKSTSEVTCDKDDAANFVTDGKVSVSGSVTAYDLLENEQDSAINIIRSQFNKVKLYTASGIDEIEADASNKNLLMFVWDARNAEADDVIAIDIVPCFITSINRSSSYGSGQTFEMNVQGADSDDFGFKRVYMQIPYDEGMAFLN